MTSSGEGVAMSREGGYDPEDTIRFSAMRLPSDWRFFNELKRALEG